MPTSDKLAKPAEITALQMTSEQLTNLKEAVADIGVESITAFNLARVKVPSGGGTSWEVPGVEEPRKYLDAVMIAAQKARQYYEQAAGDDGAPSGVPPTCASADGITGQGSPGGNCRTCPLAQFGADRSAPRCKERRHCLLLMEGGVLPVFLNLPPGSIKPLTDYLFQELVGKYQIGAVKVITRIGLVADKNAKGQVYSKATFAMLEKLSPEQAALAAQYAEAMRGILSTLAFAAEDAPVPVSTLQVDDYVTDDYDRPNDADRDAPGDA